MDTRDSFSSNWCNLVRIFSPILALKVSVSAFGGPAVRLWLEILLGCVEPFLCYP